MTIKEKRKCEKEKKMVLEWEKGRLKGKIKSTKIKLKNRGDLIMEMEIKPKKKLTAGCER